MNADVAPEAFILTNKITVGIDNAMKKENTYRSEQDASHFNFFSKKTLQDYKTLSLFHLFGCRGVKLFLQVFCVPEIFFFVNLVLLLLPYLSF